MIATATNPTDAVDFHSEIAPDFHASYQFDANRLERVRVWSDLFDRYARNARSAYDIGCGPGVLTCEMARRGIRTMGIDGAEGMLACAKQMVAGSGLSNVTFQQHRLPLADTTGFEQADLVISSSVIEYLDSIPEALLFLGKLLKPDGVLIFSVSNRDSLSRKLVRMVHRMTGRPRYFGLLKHFMSIEDVDFNLHKCGFRSVEHGYFGRADRINRVLSALLPAKYSSNMLVVVARKV